MLKRYNSAKKSNAKSKFNSGNEIINKLENLYHQSTKKFKMFNNDKLFKDTPPLTKKLIKLKGKHDSNDINYLNKKSLYRYASIDSIIKKSPLKMSTSNDPPTKDATIKYNSPTNNNLKPNIINSSSRNQLIHDIKAVTEIKSSNKKKVYKIKKNIINNEDYLNHNNFNDISIYSNISDNINDNFSNKKDFNKDKQFENQNLIKNSNDNNINKQSEEKDNNNNILNSLNSEKSLSSYKPDEVKLPRVQKDYYSRMLKSYQYKKREKLIQNSIDFYLHQQKFMSKSSNFKKKEYNFDFDKNNAKIFSELRRVPTIIAFGKVVPKRISKYQKEQKAYIIKTK